jgi:hypothetical protein
MRRISPQPFSGVGIMQKAGAHPAIWNNVKKQLAGSLSQFDKFKEAADTPWNYYVPER